MNKLVLVDPTQNLPSPEAYILASRERLSGASGNAIGGVE